MGINRYVLALWTTVLVTSEARSVSLSRPKPPTSATQFAPTQTIRSAQKRSKDRTRIIKDIDVVLRSEWDPEFEKAFQKKTVASNERRLIVEYKNEKSKQLIQSEKSRIAYIKERRMAQQRESAQVYADYLKWLKDARASQRQQSFLRKNRTAERYRQLKSQIIDRKMRMSRLRAYLNYQKELDRRNRVSDRTPAEVIQMTEIKPSQTPVR